MIYLSHWRRRLPSDVVPIAISRGTPKAFQGLRWPPLTPATWAMLRLPQTRFERAFAAQLARLDPHVVAADLIDAAKPSPPVLLCWEAPGEFCHRRMVEAWLFDAGVPCCELP